MNYPLEDWIAFGDMLHQWAKENATTTTANLTTTKYSTKSRPPPPMSTADRVSLINDAFNLAASQRLPYGTALNLIKYLRGEQELAPWETALAELQGMACKHHNIIVKIIL